MAVGYVRLGIDFSRFPAALRPKSVGRFEPFAVSGGMKRERPQSPLLLAKQEAAAALGMSLRHFERHVQAQLPCVRSGQLTLYRPRDLERWADDEATRGLRLA